MELPFTRFNIFNGFFYSWNVSIICVRIVWWVHSRVLLRFRWFFVLAHKFLALLRRWEVYFQCDEKNNEIFFIPPEIDQHSKKRTLMDGFLIPEQISWGLSSQVLFCDRSEIVSFFQIGRTLSIENYGRLSKHSRELKNLNANRFKSFETTFMLWEPWIINIAFLC